MLRRSVIRQIRDTIGRYLAIFAIIALGVGFFTGLRVCTDAMLKTAGEYLEEGKLFDFRLVSTLGLTEEDLAAFSRLKGIERAEGSVSSDFLYVIAGSADQVMRAHMITDGINKLDLISGRMPISGDECLLDAKYFGNESIGTVIELSADNDEDTLELFAYHAYKVVGLTNAPYYIDFERGSTSLGNGRVSGFIYLPPSGFEHEYFTEVFLLIENSGAIYSDEYVTAVDAEEPLIADLLSERAEIRRDSLQHDAESEINEAQRKLDDGRAKYSEEKAKTEEKLSSALSELEKARSQLDDGYEKLTDGREELASQRARAEAEHADTRAQLDGAWAQYRAGESEFASRRQNAEMELDSARTQLDEAAAELAEGREQYASLKELYENGNKLRWQINRSMMGLKTYRSPSRLAADIVADKDPQFITLINQQMSQYGMTAEEFAALWTDAENQLGTTLDEAELDHLAAKLAEGQKKYDEGLSVFEARSSAAEAEFAAAEAKLNENRVQLEYAESQYESGRRSAYAAISEAELQIEQSEQALIDGEKEYNDGLAKYSEARAEADKKLSDAEKELTDAQTEIDEAREQLGELEVNTFVLDRSTNIGYASLENDMGIVRGVSRVFPLFFFLVAALVCVTTMTRMVNEQRTQNGVLMALGYDNAAIIGQYLFYAGSASVLGCVIGFLLGSRFMPVMLWKVYQIIYSIDRPVAYLLDWKLFAACTAIYLICSLGATYLVCRQDLNEAPAELIRPKSPPAGSHIFMERVTFIWKRLKFLHKVSIRNILRYKKRMVMMILGVGGCTALLLTGFGIRDSIQDILLYQYGEIEIYDSSVTFIDPLNEKSETDFTERHAASIADAAFVHMSAMDLTAGGKTLTVNAVAFEDGLDGFIDIHNGKEPIPWPGIGETVIDYRLANDCGLEIGDTVTIMDTEFHQLTLTVSGIFDNYIYDYAFINAGTFREQWGSAPDIKTAFVNVPEDVDVHSSAADLLGDDNVANVNILDDMKEHIGSMLSSMNYVVLIVIVCAGALAFIVLYNLTNISINERRREIATLKVLGFYQRESAAYVYRENAVLTGISALCGLPMGYALLRYVMAQIKISSFYFGCRVTVLSCVIAVALTFAFAAVVALLLNKKLDRIDMADSLKAVE